MRTHDEAEERMPPNKSLQRTAVHKVQAMKPDHFDYTVSGVGSLRRAGAELNR
jgi:hypothetical protein